jgi:hypothetical protein
MYDLIAAQDPELARAMRGEYARQSDKLEMIASENFASPAVLEAAGSVWPSSAPARCSAPSTPTSSRTRGARPT